MRLVTHWEIWKLRREERKLKKESERVQAEAKEKKDDGIYEEWRSINGWRFEFIDAQGKENISKDSIWQAERLLLPTPSLSEEEKWIPVLRKNSMDDIDPSFECSAFAVCTLVFHSSGPRREVASSSTQSSSV